MHEPAPHEPDRVLVRAALAGDGSARQALLERLACVPAFLAARNAARHRPLDTEQLRDLTQDTLLVIWADLAHFEGRAALETWAYRYCAFSFQRRVRDLGRRRGIVKNVPDPPEVAAQSADVSVDAERIEAALRRLDPLEEQTVRWRCYEELEFDEIARRLGLSVSAVKSRYYRGLQRLQGILAHGGAA